jgi:tetratricopeptide (TPR) repeat protein
MLNKQNISILLFVVGLFASCDFFSGKKTEATKSDLQALNDKIKAEPNNAALFFARAKYYEANKKDSLAIEDFLQASLLDSAESKYYSAAAKILFDKKDPRCVPLIQKALQKNPNDIDACLKIGTILFYEKKYSDAFLYINKVLKADMYNADAYFLKGMCYKEMGDTTIAMSSFETANKMNPKFVDPLLEMANLVSAKSDKEAIAYFEKAFQADTTNVDPINGIAMMYEKKKDFMNAKKYLKLCIEKNLHFAKAHYNLGCILMDEDSLDKAIRCFNIAITNDAQYADAYFNRGLCKETMNNTTEALADYKQALIFDDSYQPAVEGIKRLTK